MKMTIHETVDAPVETVFDVFADFRKAADRVDGIERIELLTDGPVGLGTRFRETRIMFGRESTEEMEITQFEQNEKYAVEADSCGAHFQTVFRFQPNGRRTAVEMEMRTRVTSLFAKLMWPLEFLMAGSMKKMILSDIHQLKQHCEHPTAARD